MAALHQLTGDFIGLQELVETGQLSSEDIADTMQGIQVSIEEKAKAIGVFSINLDSDIACLDFEIERLQGRKKTLVSKKENLIEYLKSNMEASGIKSIKCPFFNITHVAGSEIVTIVDEKLIPDDFVNVKTSVSPDKNAIKKALQNGEDVPGCRLDTGKSSIRIK